jgi:hypothetical protein
MNNDNFNAWLNCSRKGGSFSENIKIFIEQKNTDSIISLLSEGYKQGYDDGCFEVFMGSFDTYVSLTKPKNSNKQKENN